MGKGSSARLWTPVFRTLVVGWTFSNFADSLLLILLAVWASDVTGSVILGGVTFAVLGLPAVFSPVLGLIVDRMSRRVLLVVAYLFGAAGLTPLFFVEVAGDVWLIYLSTFVYATVSYLTAACQSGLLKDTVAAGNLGRANGVLTMIDQVFRIALPFVGAMMYVWVGTDWLVATTMAAFVGAAAVFLLVRVSETPPEVLDEPYGRALMAGFVHLFRAEPLGTLTRSALAMIAAAGLVNGVAFAAIDNVGLPAAALGPITVGQGVGGVIAGLAAPRLMERFGRVVVFAAGGVVLGVGILPLALGSAAVLAVGQFAIGLGATAAIIAFITERQIATPERLQGRAATAGQVVLNLPTVVVTVLAASATAIIDFRVLVVLCTVLVVVAGVWSLRARRYLRTPA